LGHVISAGGVIADPEKMVMLRNWPTSHNKKQLRSFLGFSSYYQKFVKGFSLIAKPLYAFTKKQTKYL